MKLIALVILSATTAFGAQVTPRSIVPIQCPGVAPARPHPTTDEIVQHAERATADPRFLVSREPMENIAALRYRIRDYADCTGTNGCYWADLDAQTTRAQAQLEADVKLAPKGTKVAMVLDIDETSLSSYCEEIREDFGYIRQAYEPWLVSTDAAVPIPGTLRLAERAQELGVALFFITGRGEAQREATERNLHAAGYTGWQRLSLKQTNDAGKATAQYKSAERQKIVDAGYRLVLNVGDQWSDLEEAPIADHSVKLPNPFYYLP